MRELCVLTVSVSRRLLGVFLAVMTLALFSSTSGSETIQVTLYYPAPIGAYMNMQMQDYLRIGPAVGTAMYAGSLSAASGGGYGIYVRSGNMMLNINSTIFSCPPTSKNMPASVWLMAKTGAIRLPGPAALGGVCTWISSGNNATLQGPLVRNDNYWTILAIGSSGTRVLGTGTDAMWCRLRAQPPPP